MKTCLQALGLVLAALWMGCADFETAKQEFCNRNPDRCETPPPYSKLAFTTAPQTVRVGSCSAETAVQLQDTLNTPVSVTTDTEVALSAAPAEGLQFFTGAGCTGPAVTSVTIRAGSSSASFSFKGTRPGMAMLNASTGGITGSQGVTLTQPPPAALALTLPASPVTAGTCTSASVQVKDAGGSDTQAITPISVDLQEAPARGAAFYLDAACSTPTTAVTVAAGQGNATFYFQGQITGDVTINVAATGLVADSKIAQFLPGAGNRLIFTSSARTVMAGSCSQLVQFEVRDGQNAPTQVASATAVTLAASPDTNFRFYANSSCSTEVTSVTLAASTSSGSFYFRGTKSGTVTITLTATGLTGSAQGQTINPGSPVAMVFTGPQLLQAGECSAPAAVELRDIYGNPAIAGSDTSITLASPGGVPLTYSASGTCTPTTNSVSIASGNSTAAFRYRGTVAGDGHISGTATGLTPTPLDVRITPGPPSLVFTTGAQVLTAGNCSVVATVLLRDDFNNPVRVASDTPVALSASPSTGFQFFADAGCTGPAVPSVNIAQNDSGVSFYFRGTSAGTPQVSAVVNGIPPATQNAVINPGPPSVLGFSGSPLTMAAGACTPATLHAQDMYGNASPVSSNQAVTFGANPPGGFTFSGNSDCSSPGTVFNVLAGQSSRMLYVRGTAAGSVSVTASRTGFTSGTLAVTVNPGPPNRLAFQTSPQTVDVGSCSAITTVQVRDEFGNPTNVNADTQIDLSGSTGSITFYSDAGCNSPATSVTVPAGLSSASFYFRGNAVESVTITVASNGLTSAPQTQTINPLTPTALVFATGPQTVAANGCSGINTVETWAGGTPTTVSTSITVNLGATPPTGFTFYSNSTCTNPVTFVTIAAGQGSANFYFRGTAPGTVSITAATSGLTSATQDATITSQPTKLLFTTLARTTAAGACSAIVAVQTADTNNNPVPAAVSTTVNLTQTGTPADPQFRFYSDASCGTPVTSVIIPARQTTASFYYKGERARTVPLTAAATGLTSTSQDHTIAPGSIAKLAFALSTPAQTLLASTCAMRTVDSRDAFENPVTPGVTFTLAGSAAAEFYSDAGCTNSISQATIPQGSSSASFYFKGLSGGINATAPLTLTATATGLTSAAQTETIIPTVRTGVCVIGTTSSVCTIDPPLLNVNKAFLVFQATTPNTSSADANVRCFIESAASVRCERSANGSQNVNIRWSVAEFPLTSPVAVQHYSVPCANDTTTVALSVPVTAGQSFLLLSSRRSATDQGNTIPRTAALTSGTMAQIQKTGGCAGSDTNHLQVVEYPGANVQRGVTSMAAGSASTQVTLPTSVATDRSLLLYSYISDGSGSQICNRMLRGELTNGGTTVSFSRGMGFSNTCVNSSFPSISWEVVQFPVGTAVDQVSRSLLSGSVSLSTPIRAVDLSRTIVIGGGQWASGQLHGEGLHSSSELVSEMRAQTYLSDSSTLNFYRETSNSTARFTAYVVQLKP